MRGRLAIRLASTCERAITAAWTASRAAALGCKPLCFEVGRLTDIWGGDEDKQARGSLAGTPQTMRTNEGP